MMTKEFDFYANRTAQHGNAIQSLGYATPERQFCRFKSVLRYLDGEITSILDLGCGRGDFLPFAVQKYPDLFMYQGWDIMINFVEDAERRFPSTILRRWHSGDFFSGDSQNALFSAVICIDTFTQGADTKEAVFNKFLHLIRRNTGRVFVATLLSSAADGGNDELKFSPNELLSFCASNGFSNYAIDHLLLPYNLTFVVYPNKPPLLFTGNPRNLGNEYT